METEEFIVAVKSLVREKNDTGFCEIIQKICMDFGDKFMSREIRVDQMSNRGYWSKETPALVGDIFARISFTYSCIFEIPSDDNSAKLFPELTRISWSIAAADMLQLYLEKIPQIIDFYTTVIERYVKNCNHNEGFQEQSRYGVCFIRYNHLLLWLKDALTAKMDPINEIYNILYVLPKNGNNICILYSKDQPYSKEYAQFLDKCSEAKALVPKCTELLKNFRDKARNDLRTFLIDPSGWGEYALEVNSCISQISIIVLASLWLSPRNFTSSLDILRRLTEYAFQITVPVLALLRGHGDHNNFMNQADHACECMGKLLSPLNDTLHISYGGYSNPIFNLYSSHGDFLINTSLRNMVDWKIFSTKLKCAREVMKINGTWNAITKLDIQMTGATLSLDDANYAGPLLGFVKLLLNDAACSVCSGKDGRSELRNLEMAQSRISMALKANEYDEKRSHLIISRLYQVQEEMQKWKTEDPKGSYIVQLKRKMHVMNSFVSLCILYRDTQLIKEVQNAMVESVFELVMKSDTELMRYVEDALNAAWAIDKSLQIEYVEALKAVRVAVQRCKAVLNSCDTPRSEKLVMCVNELDVLRYNFEILIESFAGRINICLRNVKCECNMRISDAFQKIEYTLQFLLSNLRIITQLMCFSCADSCARESLSLISEITPHVRWPHSLYDKLMSFKGSIAAKYRTIAIWDYYFWASDKKVRIDENIHSNYVRGCCEFNSIIRKFIDDIQVPMVLGDKWNGFKMKMMPDIETIEKVEPYAAKISCHEKNIYPQILTLRLLVKTDVSATMSNPYGFYMDLYMKFMKKLISMSFTVNTDKEIELEWNHTELSDLDQSNELNQILRGDQRLREAYVNTGDNSSPLWTIVRYLQLEVRRLSIDAMLTPEGESPPVIEKKASTPPQQTQNIQSVPSEEVQTPEPTVMSDFIVDLNDYIKGSVIGTGACGAVVLYTRKSDNREVAVKRINRPTDEESQKVFEREVENLMKLRHPLIVRLHGCCLPCPDNDFSFVILTDYLPNGTVQSCVQSPPAWYDDTAKAIIIIGIVAAMYFSHSHGIIHRDLKLSNVLIDKNHYPRISDFGSARLLSSEDSVSSNVMTTAFYCAPELYDDASYDGKVDVYSFGVMLYEIVTGKLAYRRFNPLQIMRHIALGKREEIPPNVSPFTRSLIERCWAQDPNARPTFSDIYAAIRGKYWNLIPGARNTDLHWFLSTLQGIQ